MSCCVGFVPDLIFSFLRLSHKFVAVSGSVVFFVEFSLFLPPHWCVEKTDFYHISRKNDRKGVCRVVSDLLFTFVSYSY